MSKEQIPCRHVRREGESCRANNNCKYPDCPAPVVAFYVPVNRGEPFTQEKMKEMWEWLGSDECTDKLSKKVKEDASKRK